MNKKRRSHIISVIERLDDIGSEVSTLRDEEQEYIDNMPDNLQNSERYYTAEEIVYNLDEASDSISMAIDSLRESKRG